jgi:hypothetical protein
MTAPCDPEDAPEPREEENEIVLRLGDILPRVSPDLLKPGPHDTTLTVRFAIDELAEKIARGRVSVPLERLSTAFPNVFRDRINAPGETDIPLPLQRLLDQVGLVARNKAAATSSVPGDQVAQARAEAGRIIEANASRPVPEFATAPSVHSVRIAKAIFTARQVFGLFAKPTDTPAEIANSQNVVNKSTKEPEKESPLPVDATLANSTAVSAPPKPAQAESAKAAETSSQEAPAAIPAGSISLRLLPIFRLMPGSVLKSMPADDKARAVLSLSLIEPQIADGHVEVPLEDFIKALPEGAQGCLQSAPGAQVWIPLDEIFQNLPVDHPFYMPPLDFDTVPTAEIPIEKIEEPASPLPEAAAPEAPAKPEPPAAEAPPPEPIVEPPTPIVAIVNQEPPPVNEAVTPEPVTPPEVVAPATLVETPVPPPEAESEPATDTAPVPEPEPAKAASEVAAPIEAAPSVDAIKKPEPAAPPEAISIPEPTLTPEPPAEAQQGRAPWMRGFQVPPPRVFATASEPVPATEAAPADAAPVPAPTPEAKRTVDFLADQTGIFAAAAFVEGAVFASADFPRRPDLDTLRDFMGTFIGLAEESGRRLGWNRMVTISCEQIHMTAIVRERHFVVALHHDRTLPPAAYDALVLAADDLGKPLDLPK